MTNRLSSKINRKPTLEPNARSPSRINSKKALGKSVRPRFNSRTNNSNNEPPPRLKPTTRTPRPWSRENVANSESRARNRST